MLQVEEQPRYLGLHFDQQVLVVIRERRHAPHPVTGFRRLDQDGIALVVGAEDELAEKLHLPAVAAFRLGLVAAGGRKVLDPFGILAAVEKHLVHADQ